MKSDKEYIQLQDLEIYKLACDLSDVGWKIYTPLHWQDKKIMGDQFIESTDSVGANIAEGYSRFHYLDRIKFMYNSRGSLMESNSHWIELLYRRKKVSSALYEEYKKTARTLSIKLQNYITSLYQSRNKNIPK